MSGHNAYDREQAQKQKEPQEVAASELNGVLSANEQRLLKRMMHLYARECMCGSRDYSEEDDFDKIKEKLLDGR